jgi:PST family polysaccharide transporter
MNAVAGSVPRRVWGATALLVLGRQWGSLCTFLAVARLARALPADEFGRLAFWLALFAAVDFVVDAGTSTVAVERGTRAPEEFGAALAGGRRIRLAAAFVCGLALLGGAWFAGEEGLGWLALAALAPFARVAEMSAVVFQREIAWSRPVVLRALGATLRLAATLALAEAGCASFGPYLALHLGAGALGNLGLHFVARARLPHRAAPLPGMLALALPVAALGLVQQAYFWIDHGFVRAYAGPEELGRYSACVRLFGWLVFAAAFATASALPWLARRHAEGALGAAVSELASPLVLGLAAAGGFLWPLAGELLARLFGPDFAQEAASLRWLCVAALFVAGGSAALTGVLAAGSSRAALALALVALGVNVLANALCVPRFGAEGAAAVTAATEATVLVGSLFVLARLGQRPPLARLWLAAPLALAAGLLGGLFRPLLAL